MSAAGLTLFITQWLFHHDKLSSSSEETLTHQWCDAWLVLFLVVFFKNFYFFIGHMWADCDSHSFTYDVTFGSMLFLFFVFFNNIWKCTPISHFFYRIVTWSKRLDAPPLSQLTVILLWRTRVGFSKWRLGWNKSSIHRVRRGNIPALHAVFSCCCPRLDASLGSAVKSANIN